jgi:hypothetical protein
MSQKIVSMSFLPGRRSFKLFWLAWCMCMHPLPWLLLGFSIHKWNPGFVACYSYDVIEKFIVILVVLL